MGIPVNGPAYICGDNQSVLFNTYIPNSTLNNKSPRAGSFFVSKSDSLSFVFTYAVIHSSIADPSFVKWYAILWDLLFRVELWIYSWLEVQAVNDGHSSEWPCLHLW